MNSSTEQRSVWFVSFANRKLGAAIDAKSCRILEQVAGERCSKYGAMLFKIAIRAG